MSHDLIANCEVKAGGKTYTVKFTVRNDDGTTTLPMIMQSLMQQLAAEQPELAQVKEMRIKARIEV